MSDAVFVVEHPNDDAEECRDDRHGAILPHVSKALVSVRFGQRAGV
jgi:hypothetical protein